MDRFPKTKRRLRSGALAAARKAGLATSEALDQLRAELSGFQEAQVPRIDWLGARMDAVEERELRQRHMVEQLKNLARIEAVSRWIAHATLTTNPLISVVMPTRDRCQQLERAIGSVIEQRYSHWELLVVDDGGGTDSRSVVEEFADPRVSWSGIAHQGPCAARNAALRAAQGELIAYLDDDNMMDRGWLRAVAWAFEQRPDTDTLYGAFVIDDMLRVGKQREGELPWTFLHPFDRGALVRGNLADISAIAHRAGLPEAHFDESLMELGDWDLLARLTAEKDPLVLPAVACYYTTDAPSRLTMGPTHDADASTLTSRIEQLRGQ